MQATGELLRNGKLVGTGYAGAPGHVNKTESEGLRGLGPIPRGLYKIGPAVNREKTGPLSMPLTPIGHDALGRTAFYIHGDNGKGDRSASHGCPIFERKIRLLIASVLGEFLVQ